jgi:hypothetical protein
VRESAETGVHVEGARAEVVSTFREATALLAQVCQPSPRAMCRSVHLTASNWASV